MEITFDYIKKANEGLEGVINKTAIINSQVFGKQCDCEVLLKMENFQKTGSFKLRGAFNRIINLKDDEKRNGVITASAGNHAQGVAFASKYLGINSVIVMPEFTPIAKVSATRAYGAEVILHGAGYEEAYEKALEIQQRQGMTFIHAFNDPFVIAGQGTIGIEMLEDESEIDMIVVPVGGGGLIAGIALAAKAIKPDIKIIGVQAANFDAMKKSFKSKQLVSVESSNTIAEGIAVKRPGELTFSIIDKYVDDIVAVTDDEIASTILMLMEEAKTLAEGAGAAGLAAVLHGKLDVKDKKVGVLISGGNIDINLISKIIHRGLVKSGRKIEIKTLIVDRPGQLKVLLDLIANLKANIISINHDREMKINDLGVVEVEIVLETRDIEHAQIVYKKLGEKGYIL